MKNQNTGLQAGIIQIDWQSFTTRQQLNLMLFKISSYEQLRNDFNQNIKNLWSHFHCGRKILTQGAFAGAFSHISQSASKVKNESWCFNINVHSTYNPLVSLCVKRHISTQKSFISVLISCSISHNWGWSWAFFRFLSRQLFLLLLTLRLTCSIFFSWWSCERRDESSPAPWMLCGCVWLNRWFIWLFSQDRECCSTLPNILHWDSGALWLSEGLQLQKWN